MNRRNELLCVGEVLWDALPEGLFLGGAPFNVACHLHALGKDVATVSRVGDDRLGREARRRIEARGMTTALIQEDADLGTGFVKVALDNDGDGGSNSGSGPEYVIVHPAAWDALDLTDALAERASDAAAVVFGSLAQRGARTRRTVRVLCEEASDALKVLDVNLRPPHTPRRVVEPSLALADVVKLNEEELVEIGAWLDRAGEPGNAHGVRGTVAALARRFDCRAVCVTCGAEGNALWRGGEWTRHDSYPVEVRDTVGAGDAFLAALLTGLLDGHDSDTVLDRASRLGAYVASRSGATPAYDVDGWEGIPRLALNGSGPLHPAR